MSFSLVVYQIYFCRITQSMLTKNVQWDITIIPRHSLIKYGQGYCTLSDTHFRQSGMRPKKCLLDILTHIHYFTSRTLYSMHKVCIDVTQCKPLQAQEICAELCDYSFELFKTVPCLCTVKMPNLIRTLNFVKFIK